MWALRAHLDGFGNANGKFKCLRWVEVSVPAKKRLKIMTRFKLASRFENGTLKKEFYCVIENKMRRLRVGKCARQVANKH